MAAAIESDMRKPIAAVGALLMVCAFVLLAFAGIGLRAHLGASWTPVEAIVLESIDDRGRLAVEYRLGGETYRSDLLVPLDSTLRDAPVGSTADLVVQAETPGVIRIDAPSPALPLLVGTLGFVLVGAAGGAFWFQRQRDNQKP